MSQYRFHVLSIEHTKTSKEYSCCAFTQKVLNLCKMLKMSGHYVIHYGNEGAEVDCDENVVVGNEVLAPADIHKYDAKGLAYLKFHRNCIDEIAARKQPKDFLLCPWLCHDVVAQAHNDMIVVESGIGYGGGFAPYKVFESYAILHAYYGLKAVTTASYFQWYNRIIPNYYDPNDFLFSTHKEPYVLFLGMRHGGEGKGYRLARDVCHDAGIEFRVAGPTPPPVSDAVNYLGVLGFEDRAVQLAHAQAVMCPSLYIEPFCGVMVESFLSGTPVISTDWGAFTEYNKHGETGFRCHTHWEFVRAIEQCKDLSFSAIRIYAERFWLDNVRREYDAFYDDLMKIYTGKGWYEK